MERADIIPGKFSDIHLMLQPPIDKSYRLLGLRNRTYRIKFLLVVLLIATSIAAFMYAAKQRLSLISTTHCEVPRVRREWRTLSNSQKLDYINAIKCLQQRPSELDVGGSLYDDFPYMHRAVGHTSMLASFMF